MRSLQIIFLLCLPLSVSAYPGKTDQQGGHFVTPDTYHCHSQQCLATVASTYKRKQWRLWIDTDKDCQNTRMEILIRDSQVPVTFKTVKQCRVIAGRWRGVYTGQVFTKASDLDIDHIVALQHAHISGGSLWSKAKKKRFANDMNNLLPVDDATNVAKGAKNPERWKPPNKNYWCRYAQQWTDIKNKYRLLITESEQTALHGMQLTCTKHK